MQDNFAQRNAVISLLLVLTACYLVSFIGSIATMQSIQGWYQALAKPAWNPPQWLFGPVWTILYGMMGVAAWLVWRTPAEEARASRKVALLLFGIQLALNGLWSWIFFGWRELQWAFVEILVLLAFIVATTVMFAKINRVAAWLMVPYIAWVAFASVLTFEIWRLNTGPGAVEVVLDQE
jgi:translocator protein